MTFMLAALWIAGHEFHWWWLAAAFAVDLLWLAIKLNFTSLLIRRSVEEALRSIAADITDSVAQPSEDPPKRDV